MKVLLADLHKYIGYSGGIENVFARLGTALAERGYDVAAVYADEKTAGKPFFPMPDAVRLYNLYHLAGDAPVKPSGLTKALREIIRPFSRAAARNQNYKLLCQAKGQMARLLAKEKPDVIISFREPTGRLLLDAVGTKIPVISMQHSSPGEIFYGIPKEEIDALGKSAVIQVLMPSFVAQTKKYIPTGRFAVIPNAAHIPDVTAQVGEEKDIYTITCVGRLTGRTKRQHLLVEAFAKLAKDFPAWRVELWGDTYDKPYVATVKALIKKYRLEGRILLCGTTKDLAPVWEKTDIFAFPSHHEGFGIALVEAMGAGIPAVGYRACSAVNELIEDGRTGLLVSDGADALAEGLRKLMSDAALRKTYGAAAKEAAKAYGEETVWTEWEDLLAAVVSGKYTS